MSQAYNFTSDDAENYERYLGPVLFEPYAQFLEDKLRELKPTKALELACGSGRVTRHIRKAIPAQATLCATDITADMLAIAKREVGESGIHYQKEDIQQLSFPDRTFDLVVCQFGMMFLPDKQKGFDEICRVTKPGGKLLCFTWDSLQQNPLFDLLVDELMLPYFKNEDTSQLATPFSLYNPHQLKDWLKKSGFGTVVTETIRLQSGRATVDDIVSGFFLKHRLGRATREKGESAAREVEKALRSEILQRYGNSLSFPMSALLTIAER